MTRSELWVKVVVAFCCLTLGCACRRPTPQSHAEQMPVSPRTETFARWLTALPGLSPELAERARTIIETCEPRDQSVCEHLVGPIAAIHALEAVRAGRVAPEDLLGEFEPSRAALHWKLAATRSPRSESAWASDLRTEPGAFVRLVARDGESDGFRQLESEQSCVPAVAQLARGEWDAAYAQAVKDQPDRARAEQVTLLKDAGGRTKGDGNPRGVEGKPGEVLLQSLGKLYGVPYATVARGAWARHFLPLVLELGFVVPFSIKHQNGGAHELLAISATNTPAGVLIRVADPADGSSRWIDLDAFFTEPLFALGYPRSTLFDLIVPDLTRGWPLPPQKYEVSAWCVEVLDREVARSQSLQRLWAALSLPTQMANRDACFQQFEWGVVVAQRGKAAVTIHAGIYSHYAKLGGLSSWLGLPLSEEEPAENGEVVARFEQGEIRWTQARGAWATRRPEGRASP